MIRTFQDAVDSLRDLAEFTSDTRNHRNARRAVMEAYRELPMRGDWSRFRKQTQFVVPAEYSTGTIAYSHSTKIVTLTGGTWPANAEERRIVIQNIPYRVAERITSTTLRLDDAENPGDDIASGTSYRLIQDTFVLPTDFHEAVQLIDVDQQCELLLTKDMSSSQYRFLTGEYSAQSPDIAVISGAYGQRSIMNIVPPATAGTKLNLFYRSRPRQLLIEEYSTGTVSVSSGSTSATFSGSVLPATCVGSTIRFSANTSLPTNEIGRDIDSVHTVVPIAFETTIAERTSDTAARLSDAAPSGLSGVAFVISDPIDLDLAVMLQPFQRLAEASFLALMQSAPTAESIQRMQMARKAAIEAIQFALQDDRKITMESARGAEPLKWSRRPHLEDL